MLSLTHRRALRSFKELADLCGTNAKEANALLKHVTEVLETDYYDHESAAYFAFGYVKACLELGRWDRAVAMLQHHVDYDTAGLKPRDYLGLRSERKYGKHA